MALWTRKPLKIKVLLITAQIDHQVLNFFHDLIHVHKFNLYFLDTIVDLLDANILLIYLHIANRQASSDHYAKFILVILITLLNAFDLDDWLENLSKCKNDSHVTGNMAIYGALITWHENRELISKMLLIWDLVKASLNQEHKASQALIFVLVFSLVIWALLEHVF